MISIPGGTFIMGTPNREENGGSNETQDEVTVSGFKMSKYEITFAQYDGFCVATQREKPSGKGWGPGTRPVIIVSWHDATAFADWEQTCRVDTTTTVSAGNNLTTALANYNGDYPYDNNTKGAYHEKTMPVGSYPPNGYGLYDMHGNVWECYRDWGGAYPSKPLRYPKGPVAAFLKHRGSCSLYYAYLCRCARLKSTRHHMGRRIGIHAVAPK